MRLRFFAVPCALILAACARSQESHTVPAPPKIVFHETAYDFGRAEQGVTITHRFTVANGGGLDLKIDNLRTSCGCTAAVTSAHAIPSGGEGTIEATLDTADLYGRRAHTISVYSNDPAQPATMLTLAGEIHADVAADPARVYVGHVRRGQTVRNDVRLVGDDATAVDIGSIVGTGKVIEVTSARRAGQPVTLSIRQNAPLGEFQDAVIIHTSSRRHPSLTVPITGRVDGDVVVSPTQLNFGVIAAGTKLSRVLVVRNRGARAARVTAATLSIPIGNAQITSLRDGYEYRVAVALNDRLPAGRLQDALQMRTDHPEQPLITVPFSGRVLERK